MGNLDYASPARPTLHTNTIIIISRYAVYPNLTALNCGSRIYKQYFMKTVTVCSFIISTIVHTWVFPLLISPIWHTCLDLSNLTPCLALTLCQIVYVFDVLQCYSLKWFHGFDLDCSRPRCPAPDLVNCLIFWGLLTCGIISGIFLDSVF